MEPKNQTTIRQFSLSLPNKKSFNELRQIKRSNLFQEDEEGEERRRRKEGELALKYKSL